MNTQKIINSDAKIRIVAGEGERGSVKDYTGKRTIRAIKCALTKERCHGDRWSRAEIYTGQNETGDCWETLEIGGAE